MKIIDIRDIDFCGLEMLDVVSTEGALYYDDNLFYKFYDWVKHIKNKEKKLMLLNDGSSKLNAIIPDTLIKNKHILTGCAMKYIKDASPLISYKENDDYIKLLYDVSMSLMEIHNDSRNIVVGDLHFNNILIDKNMKHYFVDFDSCMVDGIPHDRLPNGLLSYVGKRGFCNFCFDVNDGTDRLCMVLSLIRSLFDANIDDVNMNIYDEKAEQINTLKNLREYVVEIKNAVDNIPAVPYLHEIIALNDLPGVKKIRNIK